MASFLRMPGVSADSDEAVLNEWTISQGAEINEGDVVASVETEKAVVDIESDQQAVVHTLLVESGATVPVGDPIAILLGVGEEDSAAEELLAQLADSGNASDETAGSKPSKPARSSAGETGQSSVHRPEGDSQTAAAIVTDDPAPAPAEHKVASGSSRRIFASPLARRIARENGLEIEQIEGSGPSGRILRKDVERAASDRDGAPVPAPITEAASASIPSIPPAAGSVDHPHTKLRRLVASRLQASKQSAPHFYLRATLRVDDLLALRSEVNGSASVRVSINDFFIKAVARAFTDVPEMNVIWTDDAVRQFSSTDIAVAIASERGLVTPVIRGAETLSLSRIAATVKDFAARAGEGRIQQHELEGGAFCVTNLGMFGVDEFAAIINPPQVGILAIGAAVQQPVVTGAGELAVGTTVTVTLSVDHRPVDGVLAARWLGRLRELIESPLQILA